MTTPQDEPAQREFVHRLIDWKRIRSRHKRYPAIARTFPIEMLEAHHEKPPYYCHYMSWRLGTWENESLFGRLEELLCCAEALPDWKHENKSLVNSTDFAEFWSLVWQLQVAEHLCEVGAEVRWGKSDQSGKSPDLSVKVGDERWYVECFTPRKSFGLLRFIEELLRKIDSDIHVYYDLCRPFQLPNNSTRSRFLHEVMSPFREPTFLAKAKVRAQQESPVVLYKHPESSLYVYVDGDDPNAYKPGIVPNQTGCPKFYVELALKEAVDNKKNSNALAKHRPNLLAVNYLLSGDWQLAWSLKRMQSPTLPRIAPNIDALAVSEIGINEQLNRDKLKLMVWSEKVERSSLGRIASDAP